MARPKTLTPQVLADAALSVIDREGLPALSMRTVAAELGMAAMSLYRYVPDRETLERLVVDRVLAQVDLTAPPRSGWERRIALLAGRMREAVAAHPASAALFMAHRDSTPSAMRCIEALLAALADAGLAGRRRVIAVRALAAYIHGAVLAQAHGPLQGSGTAQLAQRSDGAYPLLAETAAHALRVAPADEFDEGLQLLLRGINPAR